MGKKILPYILAIVAFIIAGYNSKYGTSGSGFGKQKWGENCFEVSTSSGYVEVDGVADGGVGDGGTEVVGEAAFAELFGKQVDDETEAVAHVDQDGIEGAEEKVAFGVEAGVQVSVFWGSKEVLLEVETRLHLAAAQRDKGVGSLTQVLQKTDFVVF